MFSFIADKLNVKNLGEMLAPTYTPEQELHAAIEQGMEDKFLSLLDEHNVSPHATNDGGNMPIHTAAYYGRVRMLETLLVRGIDVNTLGPRDNTPLHFAASQGHFEMVKFLINNNANPAKRNRNGRTPYDIAKGDGLRQYLLPLQFRHEDPNEAATMLPPGITPSVDPMAPRAEIAPPPMAGMYNPGAAPAPPQAAFNPLYAAPTHSAIPRGPASRIARPGEYRPIQADGFGTSVGNAELTAKYGNTREVKVTAPPPMLGGGAPVGGAAPGFPTPPVSSDGANPYSAARTAPSPTPPVAGGYPGFGAPPNSGGAPRAGPPQFKIFNPRLAANNNANATAAPTAPSGLYAQPVATASGPFGAPPPRAPGNTMYDGEEVTLSASASVLQ
ncbi:hypothetical protein Poli38472_002505 [Pythium oligandrum]|uniref:Ankyrin n=1 Tax=Pythium oligandrum TaxID=41045 RepID=A0A8K1CHA8_PYTOL|nr:hypothetical protein Poli38472_002505 [Pythium oligandrum]|eukprot:TMW63564.1 hypothetical protein Poli38472_002505 [Pythium oligandrum]